ncbi:hypothetical protein NSA47_02700 [Irregularibacter muris]|uniref:VWFA domain-containing protein n=1 Tax=Irregularibacter muris TaxID=1796619 RepID=A0AAE3HDC2_9FIRM|nr:hypothetical protein [Irregularibacter muris]MCR1897896.1 hypothetical protein [Irregularibacter muris]
MTNNSFEKYHQSQYLYENNVILCNLLDKDFFFEFYRESKILAQMNEKGEKVFPFFHYMIEDMFYTLYKMVITLKEELEISQKVKPHRLLINEVLKTKNVRHLRRRTKGNLINSYHALHFYIEWLLEFIQREEILKLLEERKDIAEEIKTLEEELEKQQQKKETIEEEIEDFNQPCEPDAQQQSEEQKQKTEEKAEKQEKDDLDIPQGNDEKDPQGGQIDEVEDEGQASDDSMLQENMEAEKYQKGDREDTGESVAGQGEPSTDNHLEQNKDNSAAPKELSEEQLQLELQLISKKIEEYEEKLQELQQEDQIILDEYERKLSEENMEEVADKAIFILEDVEDKVQSFGGQTEEMKQLSFDTILKLSQTFRDPKMEQFLKKIGKTRALARKGQQKRKKKFQGIESRRVMSDDLNSITEDEYLNLGIGIEEIEMDFYNRYLNAQLSTWMGAKVEKKKKGPIIVCYDGSASMEGQRIEATKAHLLAFMDVARKQKRKMLTIQFSSAQDDLYIVELEPRRGNLKEVVEIIEGYIGKGTDFKKPLIKSLEYIGDLGYKDADIIFMTDGESVIEEKFKKEFLEHKKKYKFNMYTILINYKRREYKDIQSLSDEVYYVYGGNWNEKISEKIFSI